MKSSKFKADEMEMSINFRALRIAFVFTELCLTIYCVYHLVADGEFSAVTAIWLASEAVFFGSKLICTHKITRNKKDEE